MKQKIQSMGRALSGMVMPNIGAFIAWGLLTAIFLYPNGWFPNEAISKIQPYILNFLLPILIAGQGGKMVGGTRGRVMGSIAILGCIAADYVQYQAALNEVAVQTAMVEAGMLSEVTATASTTPMLMAAMIMGPFAGWIIKMFDKLMEGHMPAGFEMLINNFSVGIFGMILAIIGYFAIGPFMSFLLTILASGVDVLVNAKLLPAIAIFLEPAKVLFLNNAINHGIFTPLGAQEVQDAGQSIMYMLETNPGPGLGVLIAYWVFSQDKAAKDSAPGAIIIHFFGGIHEIYFPYVLANPLVIIGPIVGNFCAIFWFMIMGAGLIGPASPGSIVSFLIMSPKGGIWISIVGVVIAAGISFLISSPIIKMSKGKSLEEATVQKDAMKAESKGAVASSVKKNSGDVSKIIFACDAGMGSSAMGATKFAKRLKNDRPDITVKNSAIDSIPQDADIVVCQSTLADRASKKTPAGCQLVQLENFLGDPALDDLYNQLTSEKTNKEVKKMDNSKQKSGKNTRTKLLKEGIKLGQKAEGKDEAIQASGELLKELGCVDDQYIAAMHDREKEVSTYLGMGIAIPHGTSEAKKHVKNSGIVFMQYPEGVSFGDEKAYLIFGIAGVGDDHLNLLAKISERLEDEELVEKLKSTKDVDFVLKTFN